MKQTYTAKELAEFEDEAHVLSRLIWAGDWDVAKKFGLTPEWFSFPFYRKIAIALWTAKEKGLGTDANAVRQVNPDIGLEQLLSLESESLYPAIEPHLRRMQARYHDRKIVELCRNIAADPAQANIIVPKITDLLHSQTNGKFHRSIKDVYKDYLESLDSASNDFYDWNLESLTKVTGGIEKGKTYVVGGLKKSGKSKFIIDLLITLVEHKIGVLFLSLEMGAKSVVQWILSRLTEINSLIIKLRKLNEYERAIVEEAMWWFEENESLVAIDTRPGLSVDEICFEIEKTDKQVILLDFLQRISYSGTENYATQISRGMAQMADAVKRANKSMVILSQVSNVAEGKEANVSHLRDSGGIAEGVDCIIMFNNKARIEHKEDPTPTIYLNVEQRDGPRKRLKVKADLRIGKFEDF